MPQIAKMMERLKNTGPSEAYQALERFKAHSWKALNSYAHAGIHPISRRREGYPEALIHDILRNANGLGLLACMHAVVLSGQQPRQRTLLDLAARYSDCMPPPI
ncbi:hypothetical protein GCM10007052_30040 [Halioglobus japonicus]|nr:hypothetical protein GCM10007052_30040 [Halioglobus japonicus]